MAHVPASRIFDAPISAETDSALAASRKLRQNRNALRASLNLKPFTLLSVCRLIKQKDIQRVITALSLLALEERNAISYLIVGEGPLRKNLEKLAAKLVPDMDIRFIGYKLPPELWEYYCVADCFILPSLGDKWGYVVHEAAVSGLPLLLSDKVGAAADLLEDGVNGFIFPAGNSAAIVHTLKKAMHPDFFANAGSISLQKSLKRNEKKTALSIYSIITSMLRSQRQQLQNISLP